MNVKLHLYGEFKKASPSPYFSRELEEGTTVKDLYELLKLPDTIYKMILVNGFRVMDNQALEDGDEVHIFQPVGGG